MIVKDLIKKFNREEILERLLKLRPYIFEFMTIEDQIQFKKAFNFAYEDLLNTEYQENKERVIAIVKQFQEVGDIEEDYEVSLFEVQQTLNEPYTFDGENCIDCRYSIIFSSWMEILGLEVCKLSLEIYDELDIAAVLFYELIRMGFSNEVRDDNIRKEEAILEERLSNFNEAESIPIEDVFDSIIDKLASKLEDEGNLEVAENVKNWKRHEQTEEDRKLLIITVTKNQNILFMFKKYISENYV